MKYLKIIGIFILLNVLFSGCAKKPEADFSFTGDNQHAECTVYFTNKSTDATTYTWDFGDGYNAMSENPSHNYKYGGTYSVKLTAEGRRGSHSVSKSVYILNPLPDPVANFTYSISGFEVTFSNTSKDASSYYWDFGDGNTSTSHEPTHTYNYSGSYTVELIATGNGKTSKKTKSITISSSSSGPVAGFTYSISGKTVSFTNTSSNASSYSWNFGDGYTSSSTNPTHTYSTTGTYSVKLTASGNGTSSTKTQSVTVSGTSTGPVAGFTYSISGKTVSFTNTSSNASSYSWNFGDGYTSSSTNPTHTYSTTGTYSVKLTASGNGTSSTKTQSVTVSGTSTGPVAGFTYSISGKTVSFTNTSSNASSYSWNFGDGYTSSSTNPTHTYSSSGTYSVKLTASGNGTSNSKTQSVTISSGGSTHTMPSTMFVVNVDHSSFTGLGSWWTQGFTINSTKRFVLRFASTYVGDCAIITESQLDNFRNNRSFTGYGVFDNQIGYKYVTLSAGSYYVAIRNQVSSQNQMRVELDYDISLPSSDNCTYYDNYIQDVKTYTAGQKMWQSFTIQSGYRYFLDGCNSGMDLWVIPSSELSKFQNGQSFQYYTNYMTPGLDGPGLWEIGLPTGTYYLVGKNSTSKTQSLVYNMERWRQN